MTINPDFNPGDITDDPIVNDVIKKTIDSVLKISFAKIC